MFEPLHVYSRPHKFYYLIKYDQLRQITCDLHFKLAPVPSKKIFWIMFEPLHVYSSPHKFHC